MPAAAEPADDRSGGGRSPTPGPAGAAVMGRAQLTVAAVGLALLVGAPAGWYVAQPPANVGEIRSSDVAATPAEVSRGPLPSEVTADVDDDEEPAVAPAPPGGLRIAAIGLAADVVPVGLEPDGAMEVPADVATVGWYELGVAPGVPGTAVLAGHVDSREQGRGAFFDLRRLEVGDTVTVEHTDGATTTWRVDARRSYPKDELPIADIFTRFGDERLVLITCGGDFDDDTRHYTENIAVYASPHAP